MQKEDIGIIEQRRALFSDIIVKQNRMPKDKRDLRLLAQAKEKNARLTSWLKSLGRK